MGECKITNMLIPSIKLYFRIVKIVVSEAYKGLESQLVEIVKNFQDHGDVIYGGKRNTLKTLDFNGQKITVKAFKKPNIINRVAYKYFRKSKAQRSFEHAQKLASLGIGTPKPIAYLQRSHALSFLDSYYICDYIDYDLTYRELVHAPDYPDHEEILRAFTRFTYKMHEANVHFKDHSPGNTLINKTSNSYAFYLVDLNRMAFKPLGFHDRMDNMKRLTPKKEMVMIMANEYAKLSGEEELKIRDVLWTLTRHFQMRFHRKRRLKNKAFFWKSKQ